MHQADKGDTESALDLLKNSLDEDGIALIDERLATIQPMHGLALPSRGLSMKSLLIVEATNTMKN